MLELFSAVLDNKTLQIVCKRSMATLEETGEGNGVIPSLFIRSQGTNHKCGRNQLKFYSADTKIFSFLKKI